MPHCESAGDKKVDVVYNQFLILVVIIIIKLDPWIVFIGWGFTLHFYENIGFLAQAEYSYFSADFRLKIFL